MKSHTVIGGGGTRLHVDETGNPNGKAILLIHGLTQCRLAWRKQVSLHLTNDLGSSRPISVDTVYLTNRVMPTEIPGVGPTISMP